MIFNSRKVASSEMDMTDFATPTRVPESESTFDSSDYNQMHPDFASQHQPSAGSEITSMGGESEEEESPERVGHYGPDNSDSINVVECPTCEGDSIHNNDKFPIFAAAHCPGCPDNNCGSNQGDIEPHCRGCEMDRHKCPGRERAYYKGDPDAVCPTCKNVGEVAKRSNHCLSCGDPRCSGPDSDNPGHCKSCEDHDLPGADNHLPSVHFSEAQKQAEEHADDDDGDFDWEPDTARVESPTSSEESYDDGGDVSDAHLITTDYDSDDDESPSETKNVVNNQEPTPRYTKHNPWCTCGGSGIEARPEKIAEINTSDEFKNGIKKIKNTPIVGSDPASVERQKEAIDKAKDGFIRDQYACKEE
jgi:hypothetical protein